LSRCRKSDERAGEAVLRHLRHSCGGVDSALKHATLRGVWLSAGPIRPGLRAAFADGIFRVGNAAGEAHPIIAEGITIAVQSGWMLARTLVAAQNSIGDASSLGDAGSAYAAGFRAQFAGRIHAAAAFAQTLMRPRSAALALALPKRFPALLTFCAGLSGKTKPISIGPGA
jgi:flavin-dependent dehydrogenase